MGYKLAGYDVVCANDIDPQMQKVYIANHKPKQYILAPIKDLLRCNNLPKVDVLDGSPPCSVFSMAGSREKAWQKEKLFREGQSEQVLDDLFFEFIELANKMQPKVVIGENVKNMLIGNAKWYTMEIVRRFNTIGYKCQVFLLNSAIMGVPQKRERVFFIAHKTNKKLNLEFRNRIIPFNELETTDINMIGKKLTPAFKKWWGLTPPGKSFSYKHPKGSFFNTVKLAPDKIVPTITASSGAKLTHYLYPNEISKEALCLAGSYPQDYNFLDLDPKYLIGMSVPPVMIAQVATQVYNQLIKEI
jgi:DNA (cytosine-5)-methyltransferase 1